MRGAFGEVRIGLEVVVILCRVLIFGIAGMFFKVVNYCYNDFIRRC